MRDVPEALAARIESGAATMCHAWIVTLSDGARLGFTDHDEALEVDGVTCRADGGWTAGTAHQELGLEAGQASAEGMLDVEGVTLGDIRSGRWDGAKIATWTVDWGMPELKVLLRAGQVRRAVVLGDRVTLEIEGPTARLDRVIGRTFGRLCDAVLGDARCGLDLEAHPGAVCDKRFGTCGAFGNTDNFRGFPDIPGDDFLLARPMEGGRHDGGSRR